MQAEVENSLRAERAIKFAKLREREQLAERLLRSLCAGYCSSFYIQHIKDCGPKFVEAAFTLADIFIQQRDKELLRADEPPAPPKVD
jgi:hypothetical protein